MEFSEIDLDKMIGQRTAGRITSVPDRRGFLRSFFMYVRENALTLLLGLLFLIGILMGTLLVRHSSAETLEVLKIVLGGYLERRQKQAFFSIAASTFGSIFISLLILFFCGFCTISQPISLAVPLFKGLGYGFSIGTLYLQNGVGAMQYVALLILPAMFFSTLLLITACRASLRLSVTLFRSTLITPEQNDRFRIKRYCVKYIAFTVLCLLISLVDAALFYKFSGLFVFYSNLTN